MRWKRSKCLFFEVWNCPPTSIYTCSLQIEHDGLLSRDGCALTCDHVLCANSFCVIFTSRFTREGVKICNAFRVSRKSRMIHSALFIHVVIFLFGCTINPFTFTRGRSNYLILNQWVSYMLTPLFEDVLLLLCFWEYHSKSRTLMKIYETILSEVLHLRCFIYFFRITCILCKSGLKIIFQSNNIQK